MDRRHYSVQHRSLGAARSHGGRVMGLLFLPVLNSRMVTDRRDALVAIVVFGTTLLVFSMCTFGQRWIAKGQVFRLGGQVWSPILCRASSSLPCHGRSPGASSLNIHPCGDYTFVQQ